MIQEERFRDSGFRVDPRNLMISNSAEAVLKSRKQFVGAHGAILPNLEKFVHEPLVKLFESDLRPVAPGPPSRSHNHSDYRIDLANHFVWLDQLISRDRGHQQELGLAADDLTVEVVATV